MQRLLITTIAVALLGICGSTRAADDSMSINAFRPQVEPVLVQVNAQGNVTSASPAYALPPALDRLLRTNLAEMIRKPATDKHGKPIASQFVMNLAVQATPNDNGTYDTSFHYVSTQPVPTGSWFWSHEDGHRLVLVSQDHRYRALPHMRREFVPDYRSRVPYSAPQPAMPQPANAPPAAPINHTR